MRVGELIISSKGIDYVCLYDAEDHDLISQYHWHLNSGYASTKINGKVVSMHRLVKQLAEGSEFQIDHKDHNRLNNQKSNLRICTRSENRRNSLKAKGCTSVYKGSYFEKDRGLYHSQIGIKGKVFNLGRYSNEKQAGKAYDRKAIALFGQFACTNFKSSLEARQLQFSWW